MVLNMPSKKKDLWIYQKFSNGIRKIMKSCYSSWPQGGPWNFLSTSSGCGPEDNCQVSWWYVDALLRHTLTSCFFAFTNTIYRWTILNSKIPFINFAQTSLKILWANFDEDWTKFVRGVAKMLWLKPLNTHNAFLHTNLRVFSAPIMQFSSLSQVFWCMTWLK